MAKNTTPFFYSGSRCTGDGVTGAAIDLTAAYQDIVAGVADGSDVVSLVLVNNAASQKTVTIADKDDKVISTIAIAASAGIVVGTPSKDVVQNGELKGTKEGPFGLVFSLPKAASKLRAKVDSVAGGTVTAHFEVCDYTG